MECPRVFSGCPNETIHSAAPYSINLPVHATLFAPHRQVPSVLRNAGILLGSLRSATRDIHYLPFPPQPTVTYQASTMPVPLTPLTIPVEKPLSKQEMGQGPQAQEPTRQPLYALGELQYLTW